MHCMAKHNYITKLTMAGMMHKNCHIVSGGSSLTFEKTA